MTKTTITEEIYLVRRVEVTVTTDEEAYPTAPVAPSLRPPVKVLGARPELRLVAGGVSRG